MPPARLAAARFAAAPHAARRSAPDRIPTSIESRTTIDATLEDDAHRRVARKLGKHAALVERLVVRFAPVRARAGGPGATSCRISAVLDGRPSVVVEEHADDDALALRRAADTLGRTLQRALRHVGHAARGGTLGMTSEPEAQPRGAIELREDDGSLYDRRIGHARADLERVLERPEKRRRDRPIDTARPDASADDRRTGYGATAARNTRRNTAGMTAALEDSRTTPSRKSTRRSANRIKAATPKQRTTQLAAHAPKVEAMRARARAKRRSI